MIIGNCTTNSNPQWGECQVYFASISVSQDTSTGKRIMIPSAKAIGHFLFLTNSFVVYSFENVLIHNTNVYGLRTSSDGRPQQFQPSAAEKTASKHLLETSLNQKPFMCSFREARPKLMGSLFGLQAWGGNIITHTMCTIVNAIPCLSLGTRWMPPQMPVTVACENWWNSAKADCPFRF